LEIFAASEHRDRIVMAGERGSVFVLSPVSGELREVPSPDISGLAWDVDMIGETLLLTLQSNTHWTWYSSVDEGKNWRVEHREAREKPGYFYSVNAPSQLLSDSGELTVWIEKNELTRSPDGQWTATKAKNEWVELISQPNGIIVGQPFDWWSGVGNTQFSHDGGRTWTSTKSGKWGLFNQRNGGPYMFTDQSILLTEAFQKFSLVEGWKYLPQVPISRIYPGKEVVPGYGQVPYGCDRLRGEISTDDQIFVLCKFGQLYVSGDEGRTFTLQFDPSLGEDESAAVIREQLGKLGIGAGATRTEGK
jgi:hypothetical protein